MCNPSEKIFLFSLYLSIISLPGQAQLSGGYVPIPSEKSFRIHPGNVSQTEVFIVRSPADPNRIFSSCNTLTFIPFFVSEGIYTSGDGGLTWQGNDTCTGELVDFHGGDPGIVIDKNGTFILTRLGRPPFNGLYSHYSNDNGTTWSAQRVISTDDLERASLATDAISGSPFLGRSYAAWIRFADPFPLMLSHTDDGGHTWSVPSPVNNPARRSAGGDLAIGPAGEIYAAWAGVTVDPPFREILTGFAVSGNGGESWVVTEEAFPISGINGILPEKANIRVNGLPGIDADTTHGPRRGWIYIVTGQKGLLPAGNDPDIILYRSTDAGATWSPGIRVNQDPLNNGKIQYFPSVHVDKYGAINVIFYDDRLTTSDSTGVFLARSPDGGDTWKEYEISDHNFKPTPIGGLGQGYQGDNIDLTSTPGRIIPVWMDNSTGNYQIWTRPLDFSIFYHSGEIMSAEPEFSVAPNPAQGLTCVSVKIKQNEKTTLWISDLFGRIQGEVITIAVPEGNHRHCFELSGQSGGKRLTPGVYLIYAKSGERSSCKKLVVY